MPGAHRVPSARRGAGSRGCAWHGVWVTADQPGTEFGAVALCCWVFFAEEVMQSHAGRLEPAGKARMEGNILGGLPGWEEGTFGSETVEGADFRSQLFPVASWSAASAGVCCHFPKDRDWHLPLHSRANSQWCLLLLGLGRQKFGLVAFLPPASPGSLSCISATSCKKSRDH